MKKMGFAVLAALALVVSFIGYSATHDASVIVPILGAEHVAEGVSTNSVIVPIM